MFSITSSGRAILTVTQSYCGPTSLSMFRLHQVGTQSREYSEYTAFESMLELADRGWYYCCRPGSKKIAAYKPGEEKVWFYHRKICRHYLHVLLLSETLFSAGLREICHFQASSYYKTLIFMLQHCPTQLNSVKPRQTLDFYKLLQQQQVSKKHAKNMRAQMEPEDQGARSNHIPK